LGLCSCGVHQAVRDESSTQGYSVFAALDPATAITGIPDGPSQDDIEKNLIEDAKTIRERKTGKMTNSRKKSISEAMGRAFALRSLHNYSEQQIIKLFGPPDRKSYVSENELIRFDYLIPGFDNPTGKSITIKNK
jgi:hypothetical protein